MAVTGWHGLWTVSAHRVSSQTDKRKPIVQSGLGRQFALVCGRLSAHAASVDPSLAAPAQKPVHERQVGGARETR
ncbi:hypothetical protein NDU88_001949 [Pleurodeles waltl]|uniref:Uncharacterized protein n=1 Tax=Pleurodeles waltl TaxID=8319 RepID=A0AAV7RBV1_PLEWA|nr:hypothetical protein NDU88_001949 [Pleurodeles waltl]